MSSLCRDPGPEGRIPPATGLFSVPILALLTLMLMLWGVVGAASPAAAATENAPVEVRLEALDPAMPARADTVTLRGIARNTSDQPITAAQVVLWRHWSGLTDLDDLREVAAADPQDVGGGQLWIEGAYHPFEGETWAPGESRKFELSAPVAAFGFPRASGAYVIGAQIVGRHANRTLATVGQARVFLPLGPVQAAATDGTNTVATTVLLSSGPSMLEPGVFVDDHLAREVAPDGRLSVLLRAAERADVSWLIDPSLVDELKGLAAGYVVRTPNGDQPGPGQEDAAAWLTDFAALDRDRGFQVPYAVPDLSMLARADLAEVAQRATAAGRRVPEVAELPLVAYAVGGMFDEPAVRLAEEGDPTAILASTPDTRGALLTPLGEAPLVHYSAGATAGGPGPQPAQTVLQIRQRMLAESFLTAHTEAGATTVRVVTTTEAAEADLTSGAAWLRRERLGDLLQQRPVEWNDELAYGEAARAGELGGPQVEDLQEIVRAWASFTEMLVDGEAVRRNADATIARAASSWWRGDPGGFEGFTRPQVDAVHRLWAGESVELTAQRSVIMSGQSGSFPMTVTNHLDQPVRVTLTFESFQPQRLSIPPMTDIVVPANQGVTVNVQPHAVGNGPVRISSQVTTPGGTPVSKRIWLTVEATDLGRVGWIIVVASGIVLIATSALRIRQVRRERQAARHAAPEPDGPRPVVPFHPKPTHPEESSGE